MIRTIRTSSYFASLIAAAVVVLQFTAVQHSIEHGGTLPEIGCEFCVSGTASASLSSHPTAQQSTPAFADVPQHEPTAPPPVPRRAQPPARGPPLLA